MIVWHTTQQVCRRRHKNLSSLVNIQFRSVLHLTEAILTVFTELQDNGLIIPESEVWDIWQFLCTCCVSSEFLNWIIFPSIYPPPPNVRVLTVCARIQSKDLFWATTVNVFIFYWQQSSLTLKNIFQDGCTLPSTWTRNVSWAAKGDVFFKRQRNNYWILQTVVTWYCSIRENVVNYNVTCVSFYVCSSRTLHHPMQLCFLPWICCWEVFHIKTATKEIFIAIFFRNRFRICSETSESAAFPMVSPVFVLFP